MDEILIVIWQRWKCVNETTIVTRTKGIKGGIKRNKHFMWWKMVNKNITKDEEAGTKGFKTREEEEEKNGANN